MLDNECVLLTPNSPVNAAKEIYVNNFPSRLIVLKQIEECFQKSLLHSYFHLGVKYAHINYCCLLKDAIYLLKQKKLGWDKFTFL